MQWMGFTLNSISLLALSLVAGVLVDDAIVEIENIVRHMRMGKSGFQAALDAADQIGLAVVATSATIIAVFLPVSFMGGITGQYFMQFGLTVAAAVFFSLLVARLITPVIAAYTLKSDRSPAHRRAGHGLVSAHAELVHAHRWKTVAAGAVFFVLSIVGFAVRARCPSYPRPTPAPPTLHYRAAARRAPRGHRADHRGRLPHHRAPAGSEGRGRAVGSSDEGVRQPSSTSRWCRTSERHVTQREWEDRIYQQLKAIPDAQMHFQRNGNGRDVNIYITGDDPQLTYDTARKVVEEMRTLPFVRDARINNDLPRPEILVHPHLDLASQLGVTVESISETIRIATLGDLDQNSAKFSLADRQVPIRVSLLEDSRKSLTTLENLPVRTANGGDGAAQGGRRHQLRRRTDPRAPLQPEPAPVHRCGPEGRRAGAGDEGHL